MKKIVTNDDGGTKTVSDFSFSINGGGATAFEADGQNDVTVAAGTYTVAEPAVAGYAATYDNCVDVVVPSGGSATCTIRNDDRPGTLIVRKVVVNDDGGTKTAADFSFKVGSAAAVPFEADGENEVTVDAGTYTVTEPAVVGYATTYDGCTNVVVANGGQAICTITNDDEPGTLVVRKVVVNDNGGTKTAADFSFSVDGAPAVSFEADGQNELTVDAGTYVVTEPAVAGYAASYSGCAEVVVPNGGSATCTITNDDAAGTLVVKKVVVNDNGGTKVASDFSFKVGNGAAVAFEADGQNEVAVNAGTYTVTEPAVVGYATSYDGCANVVVANGGQAICTITNDDQPGTLIVKKVVVNDEGGTKTAADFSFSVDGAPAVGFEADGQNDLTVDAGSYSVTEPAVDGYEASYAGCANAVVPNGGSATCTITNDDDVAPTVELEKTVEPGSLPEPGGQFTFTLVVRNLSAEPVTITTLTDDVYGDLLAANPDSDCDELDGWELAAAGAAGNADEVTCSFTVVLSGKQAGFTETDTVTVGVVDDEEDTAQARDSATLQITDVASSINVIKTASPTAMQAPGGPVTFTVVVQNTSETDAVTIDSLVDSIHGDLAGQGTCTVPQTIAAGGSYTCSFTVNVAATETDVVTAAGEDDDGNEVSASDDATVTVTPTPPPPPRGTDQIDVQVIKDATERLTLGSNGTATISYSVLVRNNGPNQANGVTLADAAPSGVVFGVITKQPDFGSCSIAPALLSCNLGTMGYGVQTLITWTATVDVTGSIVNSATAAGSGGAETNPGNNTDTATTLVVAPAVTPTPKPKPPVLKPPTKPAAVAICKTLTVKQKLLQATGAKQRIRATVTEKVGKRSKPIAGARILVIGPGLRLSGAHEQEGCRDRDDRAEEGGDREARDREQEALQHAADRRGGGLRAAGHRVDGTDTHPAERGPRCGGALAVLACACGEPRRPAATRKEGANPSNGGWALTRSGVPCECDQVADRGRSGGARSGARGARRSRRPRPDDEAHAARERRRGRLRPDPVEVGRGAARAVAHGAGDPRARAVPARLPPALGDGDRRGDGRERRREVVPARAPRPAERPAWVGARRERPHRPRRPLARRLPRLAEVRALRRPTPRADGQDRGRRAGDGDADRALLRAVEVHAAQVPDPRGVRVRDERLLEALRLAGWGRGRRARHALARAAGAGGVARLRPPAQRQHPVPPRQAEARHAGQDRRGVELRRCLAEARHRVRGKADSGSGSVAAAELRRCLVSRTLGLARGSQRVWCLTSVRHLRLRTPAARARCPRRRARCRRSRRA